MQLRELYQYFKKRYRISIHPKIRLLVIISSVVLYYGCSSVKDPILETAEPTPTAEISKSQKTADKKPDIPENEKETAAKKEPDSGSAVKQPEAGTATASVPPVEKSKEDKPPADKKSTATAEPPTDIKPEPSTANKASATDAVPESKSTKKTIAVHKSQGSNHFVITVDDKDPRHPFFGKGYPKGFLVNEVPGREMVMERGKTYLLEVVTNPLHDVYISQKEIGWGSSAWTDGITGQFIYNGTITVKPGKSTPSTLFYACRNHPYMGGQIYVINPGETAKIKKYVAPSKSAVAASRQPKKVTAAMVNQKLMFADMLIKSKTTDRVQQGKNEIAKKLHADAVISIESAKRALTDGDIKKAYGLAAKGVDNLKRVKKLVPSESRLALLKSRHIELTQSLENFEKSHKKSYQRTIKKKGKDAAVDYDHKKVNELKQAADISVKATDYMQANKSLDEAQRIVTLAIKKMMDSQTVVYDLNFETAEEEYEYELRRFKGYEILIPIAVKMKRPSEGAQKLMQTYLDKGQKMRDAAISKAKANNFPVAIAMLHDATKEVRRALRMVGVNQ